MCGSIFRSTSPPPPPPTPARPATIINAAGTRIRETAPSAPRSASRINTAVARRRYGKRALRIPLDSAFLGGGSGANIP